jgi:N-acetylglucosaminyldiphosphoundecaprenol N-acetyl-beta-D-mannosaminyltransferase
VTGQATGPARAQAQAQAQAPAPAQAAGPAEATGPDPQPRELLGIGIDPLTLPQAVDACTAAVERGGYLPVGVVNAAKIVSMRRDPELHDAVSGCGLVLADGQSVVLASRLLGAPLPERVAGIDLFFGLLAEASRRAYRVYFLGAHPDVLMCVLAEVRCSYPGVVVAGAHDGYFRPGEEATIAAEIKDSGADLLFVAMSSPRKELFIHQWGRHTGVKVAHGVGGSFDIVAGVTRRAPGWWQEHGLEWLYRALQEPRRLGPRYLTTNTSFLTLVARELLRRPAATNGRRS